MDGMISEAKFHKHIKKLTNVPEGFTAKMVRAEPWGNEEGYLVYTVEGDGIKVRFDQTGSGHTDFTCGEKVLTFDRRGVEDSFYHLPLWSGDKSRYDLNAILQAQLDKVAQARHRARTALPVPGIPNHTVTPEELKNLQTRLRNGNVVSFMPGGFGTGYVVSTQRMNYARPAPMALCKFLGQDVLYIQELEMD